jgi:hypothetical protein
MQRMSPMTRPGATRGPRTRRAALAFLLTVNAVAGCTAATESSNPQAARPDTPLQKGAALTGWGTFIPSLNHSVFLGATSRQLCEAMRDKMLESQPTAKPSPCVPVKLTAD